MPSVELAVHHVNTEAVLANTVRGLLAELAELAELERVSELTDLEGGMHFGLRLLSAFNLKGANR